MYDAENVAFKFSRLRRHLKALALKVSDTLKRWRWRFLKCHKWSVGEGALKLCCDTFWKIVSKTIGQKGVKVYIFGKLSTDFATDFGLRPLWLFTCGTYGNDFVISEKPVQRAFQKCILFESVNSSWEQNLNSWLINSACSLRAINDN